VKLGEAVVYLMGDQKGIEGSLKDTEKKTNTWAGKIASGVTKVIGGAFKAVALGAVGMGVAITGALATTIGPASDLSETVSKVGVVFGDQADEVLKFGETEPLKTLGVNLNQATIEAKAMELGLIGLDGELTASAKAQASYALVMEQTALAQGDFARTSEGLANQQRILKAQVGDLRAEIGTALLPILQMMIGAVTEFAQSETFQVWIAAAVGGLQSLAGFLSEIIDLIAWTVEQGGNLEAVLRNVAIKLIQTLGSTPLDAARQNKGAPSLL